MPTEHATFGSSTAARTNACPAWVAESEGIPVKESTFAIDGTITHAILEQWLLAEEVEPNQWLGVEVDGGTVEQRHIDLAGEMFTAANETIQKYSLSEWEPEVRCTVADDVFGTLDFIGADGHGLAVLADFKTGAGVQVSAVGNSQLLFSAWAALHESSAKDLVEPATEFVGVIWQPDHNGNVATKEWRFTREMVELWGEEHLEKIREARAGRGDLKAGDHCRFCPANGFCDATTGALHRMAVLNPEDMDDLVEGLGLIEQVKETIRALEKMAYDQLELGTAVPGWKLVAKRATRKWAFDDDTIIARLRRQLGGKKNIVKESVLTPAQMEKVGKQQGVELNLEDLTKRESSGTTLAPESDPRDAVLSHDGLAAGLNALKAG